MPTPTLSEGEGHDKDQIRCEPTRQQGSSTGCERRQPDDAALVAMTTANSGFDVRILQAAYSAFFSGEREGPPIPAAKSPGDGGKG
jgi:hypothetical protein